MGGGAWHESPDKGSEDILETQVAECRSSQSVKRPSIGDRATERVRRKGQSAKVVGHRSGAGVANNEVQGQPSAGMIEQSGHGPERLRLSRKQPEWSSAGLTKAPESAEHAERPGDRAHTPQERSSPGATERKSIRASAVKQSGRAHEWLWRSTRNLRMPGGNRAPERPNTGVTERRSGRAGERQWSSAGEGQRWRGRALKWPRAGAAER